MVKTSFTKAKHFYEWYVIPLNCKGKAYFCRRSNVKMKSLFWRRLYIDFHYLPLKKHGTTCSGNALLMVEVKAYEKWVTKVMSCVSVGLFPNSVPCSILLNGNCSPSLQKKGDLFKNHWLLIKFSKAKAIHYSAHLSSHPLLLEQKKNSRPRQRKIATAEE